MTSPVSRDHDFSPDLRTGEAKLAPLLVDMCIVSECTATAVLSLHTDTQIPARIPMPQLQFARRFRDYGRLLFR